MADRERPAGGRGFGGGDRRGGERRDGERREGGGRPGGDRRGGDRRGGRGGGRRGGDRGGGESERWVPVTKLGRLVKEGHIQRLEDIYLFSLPVKEAQIIEHFLGDKLKDEVMKITPVQKQTRAGQRTRFKAFVVVGDSDGHLGLGVKCSKEVATAIRGAIIIAKLSVVPVRRGWWGNKIGPAHTVPTKVTGKCGSVRMRLIPAPKGTGLVAGLAPKKLLQFAGVEDCYTAARGQTATMGNFVKATFEAISKTFNYLTPEFWEATELKKAPFQEFSDFLAASRVDRRRARD